MLVCSERRVLLAGCWFVVREKYYWLVADKPSEHDVGLREAAECPSTFNYSVALV
jgi:hypothetical protein